MIRNFVENFASRFPLPGSDRPLITPYITFLFLSTWTHFSGSISFSGGKLLVTTKYIMLKVFAIKNKTQSFIDFFPHYKNVYNLFVVV